MKGHKPQQARKPGLVFLGFIFVLGLAMIVLFSWQKTRLNREFDSLVAGNLNVHVQNRAGEIAADIANTRSILIAAARVAQTAGLSPEDARFQSVLTQFGAVDCSEAITYIPAGELETSTLARYLVRLTRGESVVTDIVRCDDPGSYYYSVCVPVRENERVMGVICARMPAKELVRVEPDGIIYKSVYTCLVNSKCKLLFVDADTPPAGNIFDNMRQLQISGESADELALILGGQKSSSTQFNRNGTTYFVSVGEIGYNDWKLVTFLRGPDVLVRSDHILRGLMSAGVALVLLTTGACLGIYALLLKGRKKLEREQRRYAMLAQFSDTMLFEYDRAADSMEFTSNARGRLCLTELCVQNVTSPDHTGQLFHPGDQDTLREIFHEPKEEGILYYAELRIKDPGGKYMWYGCQYRVQEGADKGQPMVVGKLVDITNQRSREQRLEENARRDILTGTYNKAGVDMIEDLLQSRPHGVLIMIDINGFKTINDTYGHLAGDSVLAQLGRMLNETFRKGDVVARMGGDEFIVFLPGMHDPEMVRERTEYILARIRTLSCGDGGAMVSASAGIAIAPQDGVTFEEIYSVADKAMYAAKHKYYSRKGA